MERELAAAAAPAYCGRLLKEAPIMKVEGGCYCGAVRYVAEGDPMMKAQCHCRECQYLTGGGPNFFMAMPVAGFSYTKGQPKAFARSDLERPVSREFCPECGTHLATKAPGFPAAIVKVGSMDDPQQFGGPHAGHVHHGQAGLSHDPRGDRGVRGPPRALAAQGGVGQALEHGQGRPRRPCAGRWPAATAASGPSSIEFWIM